MEPIQCRYNGKTRKTDDSSTKKFRERLRQEQLTIVRHNGGVAQVRTLEGNYFQSIPLRDLITREGNSVAALLKVRSSLESLELEALDEV